jgi:hypothetical protein
MWLLTGGTSTSRCAARTRQYIRLPGLEQRARDTRLGTLLGPEGTGESPSSDWPRGRHDGPPALEEPPR